MKSIKEFLYSATQGLFNVPARAFNVGLMLFAGMSTNTQAQNLSEQEHFLLNNIQNRQAEQVELLEKLVNINSGTENKKGVEEVGQILAKAFTEINFKAHWVHLPDSMKHAGTLILEHHPTNYHGKKILLIGHLDTVFPPNHAFQKFKRENDTAYGPGVADIKGGDLVILYALKSLYDKKLLEHAYITVVLTGDEENSALPHSISRKALIDAAEDIDVALEFEMASPDNKVIIGRRGMIKWALETVGVEKHSSLIFDKNTGDGAVFELTRNLSKLLEFCKKHKGLTANTALIASGTKLENNFANHSAQVLSTLNIIPKRAVAEGEIRFISEAQCLQAKAFMQKTAQETLPPTKAHVTFKEPTPAMPATQNNQSLLRQYSFLSQKIGKGEVSAYDPIKRGASDISYVANKVPYNLAGLGAIGSGAHTEEEQISISGLTTNTQRAALLIHQLTR
ncbi:M20/M25/M40 family metallo-hydrolase [Legionella sp. D16C41]|uniref:M20/M25/M40 family metallo-hydrolase n=1 Tax=Legionella sp. D16C41 TaxID=3402688 RepID=UPI003AF69112